MALLGGLLLVFVVLVRPQEFFPALERFKLLYLATGLGTLGVAYELFTGKQKLAVSPQVPWLFAFLVWTIGATATRLGVKDGVSTAWAFVGLSSIIMLVVTYAARTFERYRMVALLLVAIGLGISAICIHQGQQDAQCIELSSSSETGEAERGGEGEPDGRSCENAWLCEREGGKPNTNYACEKVGLFGTFTQGMRVRWRGTLGDPNELAILVGAMLPFLLALVSVVSKKRVYTLVMLGALFLSLWCVVLTGSRGGQLVVITVFAVYFIRRYGMRGVIAGAVLALPVLLLGGRGGEEADSSATERAQLLYMGIDMVKGYPLLGVGVGQFVEHSFNYLTAHNAYLLVASELGIVGCFLWSMLTYVSIKIPVSIARNLPYGADPRLQPFALGLATSFAGILVGIFFLSFSYKAMLFIYFGLSGALYGAVKKTAPQFRVGVSGKEIAGVLAFDTVILAFIFVYSRIKGAG